MLLIVGELPVPDDFYVVAEGTVLLKVNGGHLAALQCLMILYYILNFHYPKG